MFKKFKMCLAAFVAAALTITGTGCTIGKSTATAMTIDGFDVKAGVYIFYQNSALESAKNKAVEENKDLDTSDEDALKASKIEGMDFLEWVEKETLKNCVEFVAVNKKFDELGLKLEYSDKDGINNYAEYYYGEENNSNQYYLNGVSRDSFKEILTNSYKSDAIFESIYGKDGSEKVKDEDVRKFYLDNTSRVKYVKLDLTDADGNELDDAGKKEVKELADKLLKEVQGKKGEKLLTAFDDIKTEYDEYTAAKNSTTAEGEEAEETTETTVAAAEEVTEAAEGAESEETAEENGETSEETEEAEEESSEEAEETDSEDEETAETEAPEEDGETTETTVSTAPEGEETATETTTTPDPHANESLVSKVTTDKDTKEEDLSYTPCKKLHDWAFDDKTKNEDPTIIEDDTAYYVTVKLDLEERMTEDDLWTEDKDSNMFNDTFHDKLSEWGEEYKNKEYKLNESAVKRYKPFDYREPETTAAKKETEPMY